MTPELPPQLFLSYSREDLELAGKLAARLKAAGHLVWWDQAIASGETYDAVTEAALRGAACVVVLWTPASVASRWVRSEATVALRQGTLLPVMLADCERPVMFELSQSRDLIGWTGNARDPRLKALIDDVARMVAGRAEPAPAHAAITPPARLDRRWLIGGAVATLAAGGGAIAWRQSAALAPVPTGAAGPAASLLVMPFENQSGDPSQAWFANGISEEIRSTLAQLPGMKVIGRVSSERFRDTPDLAGAARQVGATAILTGSIRRSGDTLRVSAQLSDVASGDERWSQRYDRKSGDLLAIQSEIATAVAIALRVRLRGDEFLNDVDGTRNAEAHEIYLRSIQLPINDNEADQRLKLALMDQSLNADPQFARGWANKGLLLQRIAGLSTDIAEVRQLYKEANACVERAIRLQPASGFAHSILGGLLGADLNMAGSVRAAEAAFRLSPKESATVGNAGLAISRVYPIRGLAIVETAQLLDPFSPTTHGNIGAILLGVGRRDAAASMFEKAISLSNGVAGGEGLAQVRLLRGDSAAARRSVAVMADGVRKLSILAAADSVDKRDSGARRRLEAMHPGISGAALAGVYAMGGDRAAALAMLERAHAARCYALNNMLRNPFYDSLRGEPRFRAVLAQIFPADAVAADASRRALI